MSKIIEPWQIEKVLDLLNNKEFDSALLKIKELSIRFPNDERINKLFASIYFKTRDWKNSIKFSKKVLFDANEKNRDKIYTNIGVAYFNLGEIHKSIKAYKKSIKDLTFMTLALVGALILDILFNSRLIESLVIPFTDDPLKSI